MSVKSRRGGSGGSVARRDSDREQYNRRQQARRDERDARSGKRGFGSEAANRRITVRIEE